MTTEITGGNNQVGTRNQQSITNHNNTFHMHFHLSCTSCHQHQHQEGVSLQGGDARHVIDWLQRIAAPPSQTDEGTALQSENDPASPTQTEEEAALQSENNPAALTLTEEEAALQSENNPAPPGESATVTDSVRILNSVGQVLEPGDIVKIGSFTSCVYSLYVGDGYVVRLDEDSETVVKEKLNMTRRRFRKWRISSDGNLEVYSATQRVQRALQQVGRPCPVQGGSDINFMCWTHTGLDFEQSYQRGFLLFKKLSFFDVFRSIWSTENAQSWQT